MRDFEIPINDLLLTASGKGDNDIYVLFVLLRMECLVKRIFLTVVEFDL